MVLTMDKWKRKVAVVTGASAGIGYAIAKKLVQHGLTVVGLSRNKDKLDKLAESLENEPGKFYPIKTDITKEEDIINAFTWIRTNLSPIHILVNNAGCARFTSLVDGDTNLWKEVMDTNVLGLCISTREAVKNMRANQIDGHIIHINSIVGHRVYSYDLNMYAASKYAVTALTETLRQELISIGSKIKISSISPGGVKTGIRINGGYDTKENSKFDKIPTLDVTDIADAVIYVLSTPLHVQVHDMIIKPIGEAV